MCCTMPAPGAALPPAAPAPPSAGRGTTRDPAGGMSNSGPRSPTRTGPPGVTPPSAKPGMFITCSTAPMGLFLMPERALPTAPARLPNQLTALSIQPMTSVSAVTTKPSAVTALTDVIGWIESAVNWFGNLAGAVGNALSGIKNSPIGAVLHVMNIPGFAEGGVTPGGPVLVGERGPELLIPPAGSRVVPLPALGGAGAAGGSAAPGAGMVQHITLYLDSEVLSRGAVQGMPNVVRIGTGNRSW